MTRGDARTQRFARRVRSHRSRTWKPVVAVGMVGWWLGIAIAQSVPANAVSCGSVDYHEQAREDTNARGVRTHRQRHTGSELGRRL